MSTTNQSNIVPKKLLVSGASGLLGVAGQRCRAANKAICGFGITAARDSDDRVQFGRIDVEVFCRSDLRGQPDAEVLVDRRDVHLLGNGPPIVVRIANARGQDHSIALNLLIWKLRQ